jgi:hypothetical protein
LFAFTASGTVFGASNQAGSTSVETLFRHIHQLWRRGYSYGGTLGARFSRGEPIPFGSVIGSAWGEIGGNGYTSNASLVLTSPDWRDPTTFGNVSFVELDASLGRAIGRTNVSASGGVRLGLEQARARTEWGEASLSHDIDSGVSLVIGVGRRPADIVRGLPAERFASIAIKSRIGLAQIMNAPAR